MVEPVIIVTYDPNWKDLYQIEREEIMARIGEYIQDIQHMGSTSVEGLAAKPIIDMMIGIRALEDTRHCIPPLEGIGYEYVPEFEKDLPMRRYLRKSTGGIRTHHIHMVERSSDFWNKHIAFRDILRSNTSVREGYGALKYRLAETYRDDREGYTDAKTDFIETALSTYKIGNYG
ncbi:MAG TPA: GrpB family protein [Candidatus Kapabacteria bacterium]